VAGDSFVCETDNGRAAQRDADTAATAVAPALGAKSCFLSDVNGVLRD